MTKECVDIIGFETPEVSTTGELHSHSLREKQQREREEEGGGERKKEGERVLRVSA